MFGQLSPVASAIISMALMLMGGFLMTRLTKKLRLPNVTGYIVAGILIGPFCLNMIPASFIRNSDFLPDVLRLCSRWQCQTNLS